ncbi:hypothetical protein BJY00DRAFT_315556 [Aspergillus carlsbadensis]|nr:hypothetical protein BJY00DRAFT_315556 [Aspergillus carlsbadensis]
MAQHGTAGSPLGTYGDESLTCSTLAARTPSADNTICFSLPSNPLFSPPGSICAANEGSSKGDSEGFGSGDLAYASKVTKRQAQNREAQRRFRERREQERAHLLGLLQNLADGMLEAVASSCSYDCWRRGIQRTRAFIVMQTLASLFAGIEDGNLSMAVEGCDGGGEGASGELVNIEVGISHTEN